MTDYTHYERNMSRHEMALRLNVETALRECCESECTELKKELEALIGENDMLKKELKERRVVFEPTSYLIDIQAKDEEIKTLRKKNLDLKNENESLMLKYNQVFLNKNRETIALKDEIEALKDALHDGEIEIHKLKEERDDYSDDIDSCEALTTQPLYIENLNVTYYANGPIWTNEEKEDNGVEQTA